ncbi:MAG TPA: hypothetical protein VFN48_11005 [Solirubrobacteraceae bacterium]|nr:hypothetical protein [Solirubrobacteraceae bacterium]
MTRSLRPLLVLLAAVAVAVTTAACGQSQITVPHSDASYRSDYAAAQIFRQRCAGCHTLSDAASYGSGNNPRTYLAISGPNFNQRCERPVERVLYAIENGGFSGAYMPANIVVGQQAREVAMFVARFAGRDAPVQAGTTPCAQQPMGQLPPTLTGGLTAGATSTGTSTTSALKTTSTTATATTASPTHRSGHTAKPKK